jgi:hypothetical protein
MRRYHDWLDTLVSYARNDLRRLPVNDRVEKIKKYCYGAQDARALTEWGKSYLNRIGSSRRNLVQEMMGQARPRDRKGRPFHSPGEAASSLVKYFQLESADLTTLRDQLSEPTRERFNRLPPDKQRKWVAGELARLIFKRSLMDHRGGPPKGGNDEQLAKFFMSELLSDEDRQQLLGLPGKQMYDSLRLQYHWKNAPGVLPGGPGRDGPDWPPSLHRLHDPSDKPDDRDPVDRPERRDHRGPEGIGPEGPPWLGPVMPDVAPERPPENRAKDAARDEPPRKDKR